MKHVHPRPVHRSRALPGPPRALGEAAWHLPGFALPWVEGLYPELLAVRAQAPLRQLSTPGGGRMSVGTTSCGALGWVSDARGYRYTPYDPENGQPWPAMPALFAELAREAASAAGFEGFAPDACLINHYRPGAGMGLHQDRDERDLRAPIVSVSLGIAAVFLRGGHQRSDKPQRIALAHGDVVVWGGVDRLRFHGVLPLAPATHPRLGARRINLTFRQARA
ncbi:DNA oxidative demethylase AlkB [Pseudomonas sp. KNUC1026]|uniref:DNA oxidative demethylase AlkB n=1 Tax=Pseudomonas sp. KNUC1026 TaxID=2893890 RepID=UPI001F21F86D|nr:DNA oxidative demethylase AlkB [Pseudomonas sp. KNUC1026]UFH51718.1 DNA oxidative demethylase AlkB [Pseudomonas sp. KNUC1026]